jgi:Ca2+/H+ antiporter
MKLFQSLVTDCCLLLRVRFLSTVNGYILLTSTVGLILPAVFYKSLLNSTDFEADAAMITYNTLKISRGVAIISLVGYLIYIGYQTVSHDGLLHEIFEADEHKDNDRHEELKKPKLTLTEVIVALAISLACVSLIAVSLVGQIHYIVERGVKDAFVGLILVPLVEKLAGTSSRILVLELSANTSQNIFLLSMKPTITRSTWLSPTSWVLPSKPLCLTRHSLFWSDGVSASTCRTRSPRSTQSP